MNMKLPTLVIALALPALSYSQERRQVPDSKNTKNRSTETQYLEKNISISVSGKIVDGTPINSTITGCGRVFRAETILGEKTISGSNIPIIGTLEFNISPDGEEGYIIAYKIGVKYRCPHRRWHPRMADLPQPTFSSETLCSRTWHGAPSIKNW